jgi:hypothetical protein
MPGQTEKTVAPEATTASAASSTTTAPATYKELRRRFSAKFMDFYPKVCAEFAFIFTHVRDS